MITKHKKADRSLFLIVNILIIVVIVICFIVSTVIIRNHARSDCFERIEEAADQTAAMFKKSMNGNVERLTMLADILAANNQNPDEQLQKQMENFCKTQNFSALCIHRDPNRQKTEGAADDVIYSVNTFYSHEKHPDFEAEKLRVKDGSYTSEILYSNASSTIGYYYHAVPIVKDGVTMAILYGYISIDVFPRFVTSTAYDRAAQIYVVDGNTGNFLMDTKQSAMLGNIYDADMSERESQEGYDINNMREGVRSGKSGYYVFRPNASEDWFYTYYMPLDINNWSIQMTIDEATAFASYNEVNQTVAMLAVIVISLTVIHVGILTVRSVQDKHRDKRKLRKTRYMYEVQQALFNAHNNADFVERALKTVAEETKSETVMLLTFSEKTVNNNYYWPSKDRYQATNLLGRNIREDFPVIFDMLNENKSIIYYNDETNLNLSSNALELFELFDVSNIMLVPIVDNAGMLKGTICAVNMEEKLGDCELLECVAYDFFMAITNMENHLIIKNMGAMDYLTNIKNRNSFESEVSGLAVSECDTLWCLFVDVNGLHEMNNTYGHKAGDRMLCAVADALKKLFGRNYTYRLGGDEFVSFVMNSTQEQLIEDRRTLESELAQRGYFVSVGIYGSKVSKHGSFDIDRIVTAAESDMYREKKEYYKRNNLSTERAFPAEQMTE